MLRGIDISSHQGAAGTNWSNVNTEFVVVKATGGGTYKNPYYQSQVAAARAKGSVVGHYHYAHELSFEAHQPQNRYSPEQEADFFLAVSDVQPGEFVALDIEDPAAGGNLSDWALRWLRRVEAALNCKPLLYTFPNYVQVHGLNTRELAQYPLWWASYSIPYQDNNPYHAIPSAWNGTSGLTMWQWSGGTRVPGFANDTDENIFYGDHAALYRLGRPGLTIDAIPFAHAPGFLQPIIDTFHWGDGSAGIIVERRILAYNDEKQKYYWGTWRAETGITWEEVH